MQYYISVIITSYNQRNYLKQAIESVLNQTIKPYEILILDDCSSDASQDLIKKYASCYPDLIKYHFHKQNVGISNNKNYGLNNIKGNIVTFLDGDDRFLYNKLEHEINTLKQNPHADIVFSNFRYVDTEGKYIDKWIKNTLKIPTGFIFNDVLARNFPESTLFRNELVKVTCFNSSDLFDPSLTMYEDWDMKIRLSRHHYIAFCNKILSEYRLHPMGISRNLSNIHIDHINRIYKKNIILLDSSTNNETRFITNQINSWKEKLVRFIAFNEIENSNKKNGLRIWFDSLNRLRTLFLVDFIILFCLLSPKLVFRYSKKTYQFILKTKRMLQRD